MQRAEDADKVAGLATTSPRVVVVVSPGQGTFWHDCVAVNVAAHVSRHGRGAPVVLVDTRGDLTLPRSCVDADDVEVCGGRHIRRRRVSGRHGDIAVLSHESASRQGNPLPAAEWVQVVDELHPHPHTIVVSVGPDTHACDVVTQWEAYAPFMLLLGDCYATSGFVLFRWVNMFVDTRSVAHRTVIVLNANSFPDASVNGSVRDLASLELRTETVRFTNSMWRSVNTGQLLEPSTTFAPAFDHVTCWVHAGCTTGNNAFDLM